MLCHRELSARLLAILVMTYSTGNVGHVEAEDSQKQPRTILTFSCSAPKGVTAARQLDTHEVTSAPDGFSGVNPRFIFDMSRTKELLVLWGDSTRVAELGIHRPESAQTAAIIRFSADEILAAGLDGKDYWVYALYPTEQQGYFTRNAPSSLLVPARASVFWSRCEVAARSAE